MGKRFLHFLNHKSLILGIFILRSAFKIVIVCFKGIGRFHPEIVFPLILVIFQKKLSSTIAVSSLITSTSAVTLGPGHL